jgi:hypothetical protein
LIISTPQKSYSNNSIWDTDLPPVHLWWFSKKSIIGFAKSLGVSLRFIDAYHFYIATGSKYPRSKVLENLRPPFFDEQYNLIIKDSFSKSGFLRTFKMKIRKFVREIFGIRQKDIDNINENTDSMVFIISKN